MSASASEQRFLSFEEQGHTVLEVHCDLDVYTEAALVEALDQLAVPGVKLIVDLSQTGFVDSRGVGFLVAARKRASAEGGQIVIVCSAEHILRLFAITGVSDSFDVVPERSTAHTLFN